MDREDIGEGVKIMPQDGKGLAIPWRVRDRPIVTACCELAMMLGGIVAIDLKFFGGTGFWSAFFDPFLVPVLLLSVQYGTGMGLTAAVAATVVLLSGDLPAFSLKQDLYSYWIVIAERPTLWLGAALVVGSISDRHIGRAVRLKGALDEANQQRSVIAAAYDDSKQTNENLLLRLNTERVNLSSMSAALQQIMKKSVNEVVEGVDELISIAIDAQKFSIFVLNGMRLDALRGKGWDAQDEYELTYSEDSFLFEAIVKERRLLCIANPLDEVFLGRDGVLAGPICDPNTGRVLGMLKIEEMDFMRLHVEAIDNFRIAAEWVGEALSRAWSTEGRRGDGILPNAWQQAAANPIGVGTAPREVPCFAGIGFASSVLAIRVYPLDGADIDFAAVGEALRAAVSATLRATERVLDGDGVRAEFFVVLAGTSSAGARLVAEKLQPALRQWLPPSVHGFSIEIGERALTYNEDAQAHDSPFGKRVAA